jgi:hypothetical protein
MLICRRRLLRLVGSQLLPSPLSERCVPRIEVPRAARFESSQNGPVGRPRAWSYLESEALELGAARHGFPAIAALPMGEVRTFARSQKGGSAAMQAVAWLTAAPRRPPPGARARARPAYEVARLDSDPLGTETIKGAEDSPPARCPQDSAARERFLTPLSPRPVRPRKRAQFRTGTGIAPVQEIAPIDRPWRASLVQSHCASWFFLATRDISRRAPHRGDPDACRCIAGLGAFAGISCGSSFNSNR